MVRNPPEIFCLTLGMRTACSAMLLVKGTCGFSVNRQTSSAYPRSRLSRLNALFCLVLPRLPATFAAGGLAVSPACKITSRCFEFVRDSIKHSWDYQLNPVTCKASDVLLYGTGYCYAKSHLLAALLRANHIPAGLCYQRLTIENDVPPYCLHGLNAVYLKQHGWYRMDARGNKAGVNAEFVPPIEKLAFPIISPLEKKLSKYFCSTNGGCGHGINDVSNRGASF